MTDQDAALPPIAERVEALRAAMRRAGVDACLIPRGDAFRGEAVPADAERLAYVTGFTGSAGLAMVGLDKAALFVDGRYTLQAPAQTDTQIFDVRQVARADLPAELSDYLPSGTLTYDPMLFSPKEVETLQKLSADKCGLKPLPNLVDQIWTAGRPSVETHPLELLGDNRTGRSLAQKLADLREDMATRKADAVFLGLPESVCWLFNIRGRDVPNTPLVLSFALVPREGRPTIFLNTAELGDDASSLHAEVDFADLPAINAYLLELADAGKAVWIDPAASPAAITETLKRHGGTVIDAADPTTVPKSRKNAVEMSGMRLAQDADSVAMAKFLAWFDQEAPKGGLTELQIVDQLHAFRAEHADFVDESFDTIAGAGANGAIVHYHATEATNQTLAPGELLLLDSGGQYLGGTTDTTRTMATGPVTDAQKDHFTRVLKGMIDLSMARFPAGTTGAQLDVLARNALWQAGLNYAHGTGHGVGAFLNVHEGPIGFSPRATQPLAPGNVISNEPGFYLEGAYGIRIENLVHVVECADAEGFLELETLTFIPIDRRLIAVDLLTRAERDWLNAYHHETFERVAPNLDADTRAWLEAATQPL